METKKYPSRHFIRIKATVPGTVCWQCGESIGLGNDYWYDGRQTYHDEHRPTDKVSVVTIELEDEMNVESHGG